MWVSGTIPLRVISKGKRSLAERISAPSAVVFRCRPFARCWHRACLLSSVFEDRNLVVFVKFSLDKDTASVIYLDLEFQYGSAIWHYQQCILELFTVHQKKKHK